MDGLILFTKKAVIVLVPQNKSMKPDAGWEADLTLDAIHLCSSDKRHGGATCYQCLDILNILKRIDAEAYRRGLSRAQDIAASHGHKPSKWPCPCATNVAAAIQKEIK